MLLRPFVAKMSPKCRQNVAGYKPRHINVSKGFLTNLALGTIWGVVVAPHIVPKILPIFTQKNEGFHPSNTLTSGARLTAPLAR